MEQLARQREEGGRRDETGELVQDLSQAGASGGGERERTSVTGRAAARERRGGRGWWRRRENEVPDLSCQAGQCGDAEGASATRASERCARGRLSRRPLLEEDREHLAPPPRRSKLDLSPRTHHASVLAVSRSCTLSGRHRSAQQPAPVAVGGLIGAHAALAPGGRRSSLDDHSKADPGIVHLCRPLSSAATRARPPAGRHPRSRALAPSPARRPLSLVASLAPSPAAPKPRPLRPPPLAHAPRPPTRTSPSSSRSPRPSLGASKLARLSHLSSSSSSSLPASARSVNPPPHGPSTWTSSTRLRPACRRSPDLPRPGPVKRRAATCEPRLLLVPPGWSPCSSCLRRQRPHGPAEPS